MKQTPSPTLLSFFHNGRTMTLDVASYKAVVFDMDGTLLDTRIDYSRMTELVYAEMRTIGVPEEALDGSGSTKFNIESGVRYLVSEGRKHELYELEGRINGRAKDLEMENADEARPVPGALELLMLLRKQGYLTGVLTRGSREYAEYVLTLCGAIELLDVLVCRDDHPEKDAKPSPQAMKHVAEILGVLTEDILYIGDHSYDHQCARDSGAGFIAVLTGTYDQEDWLRTGEDIPVLGSVADMLGMFDRA